MDLNKIASSYLRGLRSKTHHLGEKKQFFVPMSDEAKLHTLLFLPSPGKSFPVILMRNPYPHLKPYLEMQAQLFVQFGYAVVVQQCRGTGESNGDWTPFVNERQDGLDTIHWIIAQEWCDGNIATYGHSYLTAAQWAMADAVPEQVKTMVLSGFTTERYRQNYMNGMFRHDVYTGWAIDNSGIETTESSSELFQRAMSVKPHINMDIELFGQPLPWYRQWITSVSKLDPYWSQGFWKQLQEIPGNINFPLLMIDGWYDQHLDGMIRDFYKLKKDIREQSKFIIGPWGHGLTAIGDLQYPGSERNLFKDSLEWLDQHLQPQKEMYTLNVDAALQKKELSDKREELLVYVIGESIWLQKSSLLNGNDTGDNAFTTFYLSQEGTLTTKIDKVKSGNVSYIYDPSNVIPSHGGAALLRYLSGAEDATPAGSMRQPAPNYRADVCSFVSTSLDKDIKIMGSINVHLFVSTDVEDTSFFVNVMDVNEDGESYNIREGITSLVYRNHAEQKQTYTPGEIVEIKIELWPIAWTIKKGHRLRLDIQSSSFPAYHVHQNTAEPWASATAVKSATQRIHMSQLEKSRIILPISK